MKKFSVAIVMMVLALTMVGCGELTEAQEEIKELKAAYSDSVGKGYWEDPDNYDSKIQMYCLKKGDQVGYYQVNLNDNTATLVRVEFVG